MDSTWTKGSDFVERKTSGQTLRIEAWLPDCFRVRVTRNRDFYPYDWALTGRTSQTPIDVDDSGDHLVLHNGRLSVRIKSGHENVAGEPETPLRFFDSISGKTLLEETRSTPVLPNEGHRLKAVGRSTYRAEARFRPQSGESFYGLGQNQENVFDLKGSVIDLRHVNTQTAVPVLYSSRGYGFFWNNPAPGRVELAHNGTHWIADETDQLDYFIFYGDSPADVLETYCRITGFPTMMPDWATGFWQSKLRYRNRDELMTVAREHKRRGLPMSVIVIDFFHWERMGEWDFDPACWPDPENMIQELKEMGVETMVSIWPTVNGDSTHFKEMLDRGYLVGSDENLPVFMRFTDTYDNVTYLHLTDFTNEEAGNYVWEIVKRNYYDRGVRLFWLDECEPELRPYHNHNLRFHLGSGAKVSSLYPLYEEKVFYENMKKAGEELPINLCRSAWAGSQRYGACVWSGDVNSDFETFRGQVKTGLNMAMAGIPWWTTDIGGFFGGKTADPEFRELIVRWFQWGVFCPVFRLHGFRDSWDVKNAGGNEIWSFGETAYEIIKGLLFMRERLRPYLTEQMRVAHEKGTPPMRPLFFDFPSDSRSYQIEDELLFGPEILVAPVTYYQARERNVYLPAGATWQNAWTNESFDGGRMILAEAPLERMPIYVKDGSRVPVVE